MKGARDSQTFKIFFPNLFICLTTNIKKRRKGEGRIKKKICYQQKSNLKVFKWFR